VINGVAQTGGHEIGKAWRLVCRESSILRGDGGSVMAVSPSRPEARRRFGFETANRRFILDIGTFSPVGGLCATGVTNRQATTLRLRPCAAVAHPARHGSSPIGKRTTCAQSASMGHSIGPSGPEIVNPVGAPGAPRKTIAVEIAYSKASR